MKRVSLMLACTMLIVIAGPALAQNTPPPSGATKTGCDVKFVKNGVPMGSKHIEEGGTYTRAGDNQLMVCRNGKVVQAQQ
jgi:hypothetical protein